MAQKKKTTARVYSQSEIAPSIYDMWLETELTGEARAGAFIALYPKDKSTLLPRPISICEVDEENSRLRIVYRIAGKGTKEFSGYHAGAEVEILGILGNGFSLEKAAGKRVFLIGGGIGVPPILETAKRLSGQADGGKREEASQSGRTDVAAAKCDIIVGYRDANLFLKEDLERYGNVHIATEDGSVGTKGNVMDAIREEGLEADVIFACGPMPMLRAIKQYAQENGIEAYISLEERMACGVGACLGCVCKTKNVDHHSHVNNARICTDGPVFEAREVDI